MGGAESGLLSTCLGMFVASLIGGFLPRFIKSPSLLDKLGIFGAGLLVGTAFCVILPEGFESMHHLEHEAELPEWIPGAMLLSGFMSMILLDFVSHAAFGEHSHQIDRVRDSGVGHNCHACNDDDDHGEANGTEDPLLSAPPPLLTSPPPGAHHTIAIPVVDHRVGGGSRSQAGWQVLCGLLVHSAADGLAVGAASMSSSPAVTLAVAAAMVAHKAPVAFGLTSFLTTQARWRWEQVLQGLTAFALAAPLVAVATWASIHAVPATLANTSVALALLFSGGTFVYAACIHVLPPVLHPSKRLSPPQLAAALLGCVLPLVFSSTLPHHH